jgi:glycosyltransferase involved in cell wall biosynthesis
MTTRRVLHVLPHGGGGAQTFIDVLDGLDEFRFDTIELSASRSPAAAAASIAGRQPSLLRAARRADLVHCHGEMASLLSLPVLAGRPSVTIVHGLHLLRRLRPGVPQRLGRASMTAIAAAANRVVCSSEAERDDLDFLPSRLRAKLAVVLNTVPLPPPTDPAARAAVRAALDLHDDAVAALYVGQLEPRKDPLTAARAAINAHARDHRIVLLIVGDGPQAAELGALGGPAVQLLGQRRDVSELLGAADVFVMPSRREGMSFAVLEALAHGVATVVADGSGNPEAVGDAGLVFAAGDDERLTTMLLRLAADPGERAALAAAGRARMENELATQRFLDGMRAVYDSVLMAPGRAGGGGPA